MRTVDRGQHADHARRGRSLAVVCLVIGLISGGPAFATSVSSVSSVDADSHEHACKCKSRCRGASCCCGRKDSSTPKSPRPVEEAASERPSNPCVSSAPCGDSAFPTASTVAPIGKVAALATSLALEPGASGTAFADVSPNPLPPRRAFRLDDPPETPACA